MALSKSHRLSLCLHRDRLTREGITSFGRFFTLVSAKNSDPSITVSRFAVLVSKKTASLAVDRNRIKRLTSALIESLYSSFSPQDYLIIPQRQVLTESYSNLSADLQNLLVKQGV